MTSTFATPETVAGGGPYAAVAFEPYVGVPFETIRPTGGVIAEPPSTSAAEPRSPGLAGRVVGSCARFLYDTWHTAAPIAASDVRTRQAIAPTVTAAELGGEMRRRHDPNP